MSLAPSHCTELRVSWCTLLKIIVAVLLVVGWLKLWPLLADLFIGLLVAITLRPILEWCRRRKWRDWVAIGFCTLMWTAVLVLIFGILVPAIIAQVTSLIESLPSFKSTVLERLPGKGTARQFAEQVLADPSFTDPKPLLRHFMKGAAYLMEGVIHFLIILVTSLYFLADGERVFEWLLALLPEAQRRKFRLAAGEISEVVSAYMGGQILTSFICGIFVFGLLTLLHVPNAILLAVLAGLFDVVPLIGFIISLVPAVASGLTVSPTTATVVGGMYVLYHVVENYLLVPRIYGDRLRLSALTVLICCLIAGAVAGVAGVIIVLPVVASYPVIERLWLARHLEPDTVDKHDEIEGLAEPAKP